MSSESTGEAVTNAQKSGSGSPGMDDAEFRAWLTEKAAEPHWHSKAVHEAIQQRLSGSGVPYRPATVEQHVERLVEQFGLEAVRRALPQDVPEIGSQWLVNNLGAVITVLTVETPEPIVHATDGSKSPLSIFRRYHTAEPT